MVNDREILAFEESENRNELGGWLHHAIDQAMRKSGLRPQDLSAVAVSNGPGSYTGLRVGLSAAKGLCYALGIPLICLSTLQIMALAVQQEASDLICPMIDARRMEVFTALFEKDLTIYRAPYATTLTVSSWAEELEGRSVLFTGNGSHKLKPLLADKPTAQFLERNIDARDMIVLSSGSFNAGNFADVAYCEPFYVKEVYIAKKTS